MVEVKKKESESLEGLLRRFSKRVQQSGVLIRAKKGRFHEKGKTKREMRLEASRRVLVRDKKEYLRKIGKLDDILEKKKGGRRIKRGIAKRILKTRVR
ncbi:30S ribosomal protein S21 [Patescibacteria group bacterium]